MVMNPEEEMAASYVSPPSGLDAGLAMLLEAARDVASHSYSPYSKFRVGAALKLTSGEIVTGTNVESASYGLTICAERVALVRAISEFGPAIRIGEVAVANLHGKASPPCGACRQMLSEFALSDASAVLSRVRWRARDSLSRTATTRVRNRTK